jgi:hypothetical protein
MNKMGYLAVPYLFLMFLAFAIVDGVRAAVKRARVTRNLAHETENPATPMLSPYAHECVDRPHLTCPACAWSEQRYRIRGQSLLEVCVMLTIVLALAAALEHGGVHIREALRDVVTCFHY